MNLFKKYFWNIIKNHYADFNGRATRKQYWLFFLCHIIITAIVGIFIGILLAAHLFLLIGIFIGFYILYALATLVPRLALGVKRLHDTGQSGWWFLIALVPYIGIVLILFFCLPSQEKENKWGNYHHSK